jgi:hypothetical protein
MRRISNPGENKIWTLGGLAQMPDRPRGCERAAASTGRGDSRKKAIPIRFNERGLFIAAAANVES